MEFLLATLPLSLSSGINLYLTILAVGFAGRAELVSLPSGLDFVSSIPVLAVAGTLFVIEFFADKTPYLDSVWDFFHTFIRPAGALVLALGLVPADAPELRTAALLIAGTTALTAHSGKASFRALVNTSPEPVSNSVVSVAEDLSVIGLLALMTAFPLAAAVVSVILLVGIVIAIYSIFRWARRAFGSLRNFFSRNRTPLRNN
jgi:hypothetical protein